MLKALRIVGGSTLTGLLFYAASLAVRECSTGFLATDNCLWLWLRHHLGLPPSRLGRSVALEIVGLALLAALYFTIRYVFGKKQSASDSGA